MRDVSLSLTEGTSIAAAVSPDRLWIAFDLLGSVWVMPFRGGEATRISPELLEARQPTWAPDSQTIAFQGFDDTAWHLYTISRRGEQLKQLTSGDFDDREPAWSNDGLRIAFSSDRAGGVYTIWQVIVATGDVGQVGAHDGWMPSWSPNDHEITFVTEDRVRGGIPTPPAQSAPGLWAVDARGKERVILAFKEDTMPSAAASSTDGRSFAYVSGGRLFVNGEAITKDEDVFPLRPQWLSPTTLLYTAGGHIKRRALGGLNAVTIPFTARITLHRPSYTIAHRVLDPTEPQRVAGIVNPVVSPDGRAVAFVAMNDVWVLSLGGVPIRVTDDSAKELDPAWSPDGAALAFSSDRGGEMDLWVHDFRTNEDRQITRDAGGRVTGAAWSPDGSQLAYLVDRRSVLTTRIAPGKCPGGGERMPLGRDLGRPTWGPDCLSVAVGGLLPFSIRFLDGFNALLTYSFTTHSWSSSVLFEGHSVGNRQDTGPVWAPDGNSIVFATEDTLWTVAVDSRGVPTAPAVPVATDHPESPSWEADSRHIVYLTPGGLRRIPADGGSPTSIALSLAWRSPAAATRVVVHAGGVLDGTIDGLRGESDIVIENGFISEVAAHSTERHTGRVVDAPDEIVIPGLVDMHAHHDRDYGADFGRVLLAYGITTVRIPGVNPYEGLELRESFDADRRPGPRVVLAGDWFDGARTFEAGGVSIRSDDQLERELERATQLGTDFIKTYVRLPVRWQKRVVEYAHDRGLPVTSHDLFPTTAFGIDGVEHLAGTSRHGYSTRMSGTLVAYRDVIDLFAKSGVTLTPTMGILGGFEARMTNDRSLLTDNRLGLYPKPVVLQLADVASRRPDPRLDARMKPYETMLKAIVTAGGTIVAGTDAPLVPYGLSLHAELEEYVRAGMTPFQALQTATVNAAVALGLSEELGTIEPGKRADLTFLGSNPLLDIRNTRDVKRVMRSGRLYTVPDLVSRR
jgi:Tol biopolymer transport system component